MNQRMRTESILSPRPERRESGTQEPGEPDLPRPSAPPADEVLTPPMVTPPESPERHWDPLPMPDGYLPDPIDLDEDVQPEIEDEIVEPDSPVGMPDAFDDDLQLAPAKCDVLQAYFQKGGSSGSRSKV